MVEYCRLSQKHGNVSVTDCFSVMISRTIRMVLLIMTLYQLKINVRSKELGVINQQSGSQQLLTELVVPVRRVISGIFTTACKSRNS